MSATESVSVFTKVCFGPFRSVSVHRESVSVLRVRFGIHKSPFRSVPVLRESVLVLRESVSVSTKVRFGPFRSVSVNRDTVRKQRHRSPTQPISTFVFATQIVQSLYILNPVCVGPGRKPRRQLFSRCGTYV